ncbi:ATP-dependent RNA helicase TDRD9 [Nymphon striatum]|nr:ATP-dependent RNA helicase TDRD9 [Nymphon striatum]
MSVSGEITADALKSFFRQRGEIKKIVRTNVTATDGKGIARKSKEDSSQIPSYKQAPSNDYTKQYVEDEERSMIDTLRRTTLDTGENSGMFDLEEISNIGDIPNGHELDGDSVELYDMYHTPHKYDPNLPITRHKDKITNMIDAYQVVVIQGSTGCGKTTQVPQYILDYHAERKKYCNIVVTQPRRIAAISIASRVCQERGWSVGELVGYQVGMDKTVSQKTCLTYMTTGVLLQKLVSDKRMDSYTHVIIDEVHERDQYTDFTLLIVRKFLRSISRGVKVILMSATINTKMFAEYFSMPVGNRLEPAPVIEIEGKSYTVSEFYLNDLQPLGNLPTLSIDAPNITYESYLLAITLIKMFDRIEHEEKEDKSKTCPRGAVLVFLPGIFEIQEMERYLRENESDFNSSRWRVLPLHSTITIDEQKLVFAPPPKGMRKLILSTNIAESSITVKDVKYVIDFCLVKHLICDRESHFTCLQMTWTSQANCTQRRGRAGRVSNGRVYRMVTKSIYEQFPEYSEPEMTRCPLENTVLKVKQLDLGEPKAILALALEPPSIVDLERTIVILKEIGALSITNERQFNRHDGELTFIGSIMAALPLDVKLSKLVTLGYVFGYLERCIIIAASMASKTFFSRPFRQAHEAYKTKCSWSFGSFCDLLTTLHVYEVWQAKRLNGEFKRPGGETEVVWCRKNYIQLKRILDVEIQVEDLKLRMSQIGIQIDDQSKDQEIQDDMLILKLLIAAAFYPNYFVMNKLDEVQITKEISGLDPMTTVVLGGLPADQGILYTHSIINMLQKYCQTDLTLTFEDSKAYAQFIPQDHSHTGQIHPAVYFAVKIRQLRLPLEIGKLNENEARLKMKQIEILAKSNRTGQNLDNNRLSVTSFLHTDGLKSVKLPDLDTSSIELMITHIVDCGYFWAQHSGSDNNERFRHMNETLRQGLNTPLTGPITPGMTVLAPFEGEYYRARVEATYSSYVSVMYVDFGNSFNVQKSVLYAINPETSPSLLTTPALAFECALSEIRPSACTQSNGKWSKEALQLINSMLNVGGHHRFHGKIFSVVQGVVRMELFRTHDRTQTQISINDMLISKGFAEKVLESYLSRQNHSFRLDSLYYRSLGSFLPKSENSGSLSFSSIPSLDSKSQSKVKLRLRGPLSPLEVDFRALTRAGSSKSVRIDVDSVNSIVLDPEPWDKSQNLLISSHVDLSSSLGTIKARGTTLMPNIKGLAALIPLMFTPRAELRVNEKLEKYTGAICGLGVDPITNCPFYPDHDMEITFDVEFTNQDISLINEIRSVLNTILGKGNEFDQHRLFSIQKHARQTLLKLNLFLFSKFDILLTISVSSKSKEFPLKKCYFQDILNGIGYPKNCKIVSPTEDESEASFHILPLHSYVELNLQDKTEEKLKLLKHIQELHEIAAKKSHHYILIKCDLCSEEVYSSQELVIHLISDSHVSNENSIKSL